MSRHVYFSSFICSISLILFENLKPNNSVTEMTNKKTKQLSTSNKEIKHNKQVKYQVCQPAKNKISSTHRPWPSWRCPSCKTVDCRYCIVTQLNRQIKYVIYTYKIYILTHTCTHKDTHTHTYTRFTVSVITTVFYPLYGRQDGTFAATDWGRLYNM